MVIQERLVRDYGALFLATPEVPGNPEIPEEVGRNVPFTAHLLRERIVEDLADGDVDLLELFHDFVAADYESPFESVEPGVIIDQQLTSDWDYNLRFIIASMVVQRLHKDPKVLEQISLRELLQEEI